MAEIKLTTSNLNLSKRDLAAWSAKQYRQFLDKTGYQGYEYTPVRSIFGFQLASGNATAQDCLTSLHQSFRGHASLGEKSIKNIIHEVPFIIAMPSAAESLNWLWPLAKDLGLDSVVYPSDLDSTDIELEKIDYNLENGLGKKLFQPTAEVFGAWGLLGSLHLADDLQLAMQMRGLDAVCLDTHHWLRSYAGQNMPDWQTALPDLAQNGLIQQVHLCPARPDIGEIEPDLHHILNGDFHKSQTLEMLGCVLEASSLTKTPVVVEMPQSAIAHNDTTSVHKELVDAVNDYANSV